VRVCPEGTEEWLEPSGQVVRIIAICMLSAAIALFGFRLYQLQRYPKVEATITSIRVVENKSSDSNQPLCGVEMTLDYFLTGRSYTFVSEPHSFSNCAPRQSYERRFVGRTIAVLVDPRAPANIIPNPSWTIEFFLASFVLAILGVVFFGMSTIFIHVGRRLIATGTRLP
jgi:hypothetical protein